MRRATPIEVGMLCMIVTLFVFFAFAVCDRDQAKEQLADAQEQIDTLRTQLAYMHEHPYVVVIDEPDAKSEAQTVKQAEKPTPTEMDDVSLLARLIMCEIGSDGHPDEQLYNVGSVVINRINDSRFPNTLRGVIYQAGQYGPAITGIIENAKPTQRCYDIASDLLANGSRLPADVVWQSGVSQGTEVYAAYTSPITGTTTYYCR